jgi:hypothetical protein
MDDLIHEYLHTLAIIPYSHASLTNLKLHVYACEGVRN